MKHTNENNEGKSAIATGIVAILFLCLCFLISCWEQPGPPWPDSPTGMTLSFGSVDGTTDDGTPQNSSSEPVEQVESEPMEIVGSDVESEVEVNEVVDPVVNNNPEVQETNTNPTEATQTNPTESTDPSDQTTENPPLYTDPGNAAGDPEGNPDDGDPNGNTPLYVPGENPGNGTGKGGDGNGLVMDSWGWNSVPDTKKVKHQGVIKVKIVVDDEGNITSITFPYDVGAFDIDDQEAIKEAIRKSGVKAKNSSGIPPEREEGIATFIIKR